MIFLLCANACDDNVIHAILICFGNWYRTKCIQIKKFPMINSLKPQQICSLGFFYGNVAIIWILPMTQYSGKSSK